MTRNSLIIFFLMMVLNLQSANAFLPAGTSKTSGRNPEDWQRYQQLQQERIQKIAERIISTFSEEEKLEVQNIRYLLSLDSQTNAMVTFGKKMIIHKGLLDFIQDDNELAFVIGHELGHVVKHHHKKKVLSTVLGVGLEMGAQAIFSNWSSMMKTASPFAQQSFSSMVANAFSEQYETTADAFSLPAIHRAGFNVEKAIDLHRRLAEKNGEWNLLLLGYVATHPPSQARYQRLKIQSKGLSPVPNIEIWQPYAAEELISLEQKLGIDKEREDLRNKINAAIKDKQVKSNWLNKLLGDYYEDLPAAYQGLGIKNIGLVSTMKETKNKSWGSFQKEQYFVQDEMIIWFMHTDLADLKRGASAFKRLDYRVLWYMPDGTLYSEQLFANPPQAYKALTAQIHFDNDLMPRIIGQWKLMAFENDRLIDTREFQVVSK